MFSRPPFYFIHEPLGASVTFLVQDCWSDREQSWGESYKCGLFVWVTFSCEGGQEREKNRPITEMCFILMVSTEGFWWNIL